MAARMGSRSLVIPAVEPNDHEEVKAAVAAAHRLWLIGIWPQAAEFVQHAAEAALAGDADRRGLELARAAADLREAIATGATCTSLAAPCTTGVSTENAAVISELDIAWDNHDAASSAPRSTAPKAGPAAPSSPQPSRAAGLLVTDPSVAKPPHRNVPVGPAVSGAVAKVVRRDDTTRTTPARTSTATSVLTIGEAIRVWVGPNGEMEPFTVAWRRPKNYVDAMLVTMSPLAGLANRLSKRQG